MDIKWLDDFLSLAQTRNFSRSAQERCVTQSALSRRIQALEAWVGTDLVDRSTYPLVLTPAGKMFGTAAAEAMRLLNDARALLRVEQSDDQVLRVCAGHALALNLTSSPTG
jgi:LysR family transcriptional regulator, hypochlorite-specific transcription factor HypT